MVSESSTPDATDPERPKHSYAAIAAAAARASLRETVPVVDSTEDESANEAILDVEDFRDSLLDYMSRRGGRINISEIIRKFIGADELSDDQYDALKTYLATIGEIRHTRRGWFVIVDHEAYLRAHPRPTKKKSPPPVNHDLEERLRSLNLGPGKPRIVQSLNNTTARRGGAKNW